MKPKTIIEPFKIKSVEPIRFTTREEREKILIDAGYNPFMIHADDVLIDLLTDSGTSAMSAKQWAGIMEGDEAYAGSKSFYRFEAAVKKITGLKFIIPTHQGRAAEKILFSIVGGPGKYFPNNTHFDTTRSNIEFTGSEAADFLIELENILSRADFKGNMDIEKLKHSLKKRSKEYSALYGDRTNNSGGGQTVSMHIKDVKLSAKMAFHLFLDACRFAENAYFIKKREKVFRINLF
jgi:tryptophanase